MKEHKCPWTLVQDTREQEPWLFEDIVLGCGAERKLLVLPKRVTTLKSGDYSIFGFEKRVAIERKSKSDLYGTIGAGRKRFIRELDRLNKMEFAAVIVEASWLDCIKYPPERSKVSPSAVNGSILAFMQRFIHVHWLFMPGRMIASKQCFKILDRFWEDNGGSNGR